MAGRTGRRGSVRQESNGSWSFTVDVADATGRRRQAKRRGFPSRRLAQSAMTALIAEMDKGVYVAPSRQTLKAFLEREWLPAIAPTIRPATLDSYTRVLRLHVSPMPIGNLALQDIDGPRLNVLYAQLLRPKPKGHGLSPRSVQYVHVILHRAFRDALRWDRLFRNPCDAADPPRGLIRPRLRVWSAEELREFLRLAADDRLVALWHLIATTGMRRGEALGLQWEDVDLDAGRLSIKRTLIQIANYNKDGTRLVPRCAKDQQRLSARRTGPAHRRRSARTPRQAIRRALGTRQRLSDQRVRLHPARRPTSTSKAGLSAVPSPRPPARHAATVRSRTPTHVGDVGLASRCPPEGRPRAARPFADRRHSRHLQPRHAGHGPASRDHGRRTPRVTAVTREAPRHAEFL